MRSSTKLIGALVLLFIVDYLCLSTIDAYKTSESKFKDFRLPRRIRPQHYELLLKPNLESPFDLEGQVKIDFQVIHDPNCDNILNNNIFRKAFGCEKNEIILHVADKLTITDASVSLLADGAAATPIKINELSRDTTNQFLVVKMDRKLEKGALGQLELKFTGDIQGEPGQGIFLNEYVDPETKQTKHYASTLFESVYARNALPCFDEPEMKATFDVIIEHAPQLTALANTEQVKQEPASDGLVRTYFARSPKMSTYLLAFAVGEFDHLESEILDGKLKINLIAPKGQSERGKFALDIARRSYASLLDYFGIDQPLKKIDLLSTKDGGAMENWGLIAFDEKDFLRSADKEEQTTEWEAHTAMIIVHELAHHWFGNLVTMKWWDDLWLNEGFAVWMSYEKANEILPEFNYPIYYLQQALMPILANDADSGTHPVRQPELKTAQEIDDSFDMITYEKGSAIVRMLDSYLGKENFKLALREYIQKHSYGNARADDLWTILQDKTGLPVGELMKSWLDQPGFPLINVELVGGQKKLLVKQKRFMDDYFAKSMKQQQRWMVPITMLIGGGDEASPKVIKFVLEQSKDQMEVSLPSSFDVNKNWLKLNADFEGFYRVQYSQELLNKLREPIETKSMSPIDRINLLDDAAALYQEEKIDIKQLDEVLDWFRHEDHPGVVYSLAKIVQQLYYRMRGERHLKLVNRFNKINRLNLNAADGFLEQRERAMLLSALVFCDHEPTTKEALELFDAKTSAGELISPIISESVYLAVAKSGSDEQLHKLKLIFNKMQENVRIRLINKIFRTVDSDRRDKVLD